MSGSCRPRHRSGFSLVELLVIVAILAVFIAMLLPAINRVRETANRAACLNNLRQIGLALQTRMTTYGCYPPGGVTGPAPEVGVRTKTKHSWIAVILNDLDQKPLAQQYTFNASWNDAANEPAITHSLRIVTCPSSPPGRVGDSKAAASDYAAVNGIASDTDAAGYTFKIPSPHLRGCMYENSRTRPQDISDGLGNTIMIAEDSCRPQLWRNGRKMISSGNSVSGAGWADRQNVFAIHGASADGSVIVGPYGVNRTNSNEIFSLHPGGANVLFADGSARFLSEELSTYTVGILVTRDGRAKGEPEAQY